MKTIRTLVGIALVLLSATLLAQRPRVEVHLASVKGCPGEILSLPVKLSGAVADSGLRSFNLFFDWIDTAYIEPVLTHWDPTALTGTPLISNIHPQMSERGMQLANFFRSPEASFPNPTFSVVYFEKDPYTPRWKPSPNDTLFSIHFRIKKEIDKPVKIRLITTVGSQISWDALHNLRFEIAYHDTARISSGVAPVVKIDDSQQWWHQKGVLYTCDDNQAYDGLSALGNAVRYEWSIYYGHNSVEEPPGGYNPYDYLDDPFSPTPILRNPVMPKDIYLRLKGTNAQGCSAYDSVIVAYQHQHFYLKSNLEEEVAVRQLDQLQPRVSIHRLPGMNVHPLCCDNPGSPDAQCMPDSICDLYMPYAYRWEPAQLFVDNTTPKPQTLPLTEAFRLWVQVTDRFGCNAKYAVAVDVVGDELSGKIDKPLSPFCGVEGQTKHQADLIALYRGGYDDKSYEWAFKKLYNGKEPALSSTSDKKVNITFFGLTEVSVRIKDNRLGTFVDVVDTLWVNDFLAPQIQIDYDGPTAEKVKKGLCVSTPVAFEAVMKYPGQNPRVEWEVGGLVQPQATGNRLVIQNIDPGQSVRAFLYSSEACAQSPRVASNVLKPEAEFYQLTGIQIANETPASQRWNNDSVKLRLELHNPGHHGKLSLFRNHQKIQEMINLNDQEVFQVKVKSDNYWDAFYVVFENTSGKCLINNHRASNYVYPHLQTSADVKTLRIVSDMGGDTVCDDPSQVYTFRLHGPKQYNRDATVIWMVNDTEWGRYATTLHPDYPMAAGALRLNDSLQLDDQQGFAKGYPFSLNTKHFPTMNTAAFPAGARLWAVVISSSDFGGNLQTSADTVEAIVPQFMPIHDASLSLLGADPICQGKSLTLTAQAQNAGAPRYDWILNGEVVAKDQRQYTYVDAKADDQLQLLLSSTYSCARNLPLLAEVPLQVHPSPQLQMPKDTLICQQTSLELMPITEGVSFAWTDPNATLSALDVRNPIASPGSRNKTTYVLEVTDVHGCQSKDSVVIATAPKIPVTLAVRASDTTICRGELVTLFATMSNHPGTQRAITWFKNGFSIPETTVNLDLTQLRDGDVFYGRMSTNVVSCLPTTVNSSPITFRVNNPFRMELSYDKEVLCGPDTVLLIADGAPSYRWESKDPLVNGSTLHAVEVSPLVSTVYVVRGQDLDGICQAVDSVRVLVDVFVPIENNLVVVDREGPHYCQFADNHFTLRNESRNGGHSPIYTWYLNGVLQNEWIHPQEIQALNDGDRVSCEMLASEDIHSCGPLTAMSQELLIRQLPAPVGEAKGDTGICPKQSTQLFAQGGIRYLWMPAQGLDNPSSPTPLATPEKSTPYRVQIFGDNGCFIVDSVNVDVFTTPDALSVKVVPWKDSLCEGQSIRLFVQSNHPGKVSWFRNETLLPSVEKEITTQALSTDVFKAQVQAKVACLEDQVVTSADFRPSFFRVNIDLPQEVSVCEDQSFTLPLISNAHSFVWIPNFGMDDYQSQQPTIQLSHIDKVPYQVTARIGHCSDSASIQVNVLARPSLPQAHDERLCQQQTAVLAVLDPHPQWVYLWYKDTTEDIVFTGPLFETGVPATYYLRTLAPNTCKSLMYVPVNLLQGVQPKALFEIQKKDVYVHEPTVFANTSREASKAWWTFGDGNVAQQNFEEGDEKNLTHVYTKYGQLLTTLVVESPQGCRDTVQRKIHVKPQLKGLFVPSAFAPAATHPEDRVLKVYGEDLASIQWSVYTLTGVEIYRSQVIGQGWDGTFNGKEMPTGNYSYRVVAKTIGGDEIVQSGSSLLIR